MKKRIFCLITIMLLILSLSCTAIAESTDVSKKEVENSSNTSELSNFNPDELAPSDSLQLMYAKLQLDMANIAKDQAFQKMSYIQTLQEEQKQVSNFLNTAKEYQRQAYQNDTPDIEAETEMPADMAEYMITNNLVYDMTGNDLKMTGNHWDTAIVSLENHLEKLGAEVQQEMIYLQNFMGQYNSYLQGANSNQTLTSLARGQSMYGDSKVGLVATSLVVGIVLGCVITLALQKFSRKKNNT